MVTLEPRHGESLEDYLLRCLAAARRSQTRVLACYDQVEFVITSTMRAEDIAAACRSAPKKKQRRRA